MVTTILSKINDSVAEVGAVVFFYLGGTPTPHLNIGGGREALQL